jgi:hypothetical protein
MSKAEDIVSRQRRTASAFALASDLLAEGDAPAQVKGRLVNAGLSNKEAHEIVSALQVASQRVEKALRGRDDLRSRAENYLNGPRIISEPGASLTRLIARYVAGKPWDDPELRNLLSECIGTAQTEAAGCEGDARTFYLRAAAILQEIQAEMLAGRV